MSAKDDGGKAFPSNQDSSDTVIYRNEGMTLRDYFAGQALAGMMSRHAPGMGPPNWQEKVAWDAYSVADVMLRERGK